MSVKNWKEFIKDIPTEVLEAELLRREEDYRNNISVNPIARDIMVSIDYALSQFGEYTFSDKGPSEVMSVLKFKEELKDLSAKEVGSILSEVLDNYETFSTIGKYGHAEMVVNEIIGNFDSMPDEWFDELLDSDMRFEY